MEDYQVRLRGWTTCTGELTYIVRLNERLRFLKYGPGQYFEPHCDANYSTYSGTEGIPASELSKLQPEEKSLITFHLYLTDVEEGAGGATTIHSWNLKESLDIHSKQGRVMIFQQRDLLHSGQKLTSGVKYTLRSDLMYTRVVKDKK